MKTTRIILIFLTALALGFSVASSSAYKARDDAERAAYYQEQEETKANGGITFSGPYCYPDRHPGFLFGITVLIGGATFCLFWFKSPLWSMPASLLAFLMYPYWYWWTWRAISMVESVDSIKGLDLYLYKANGFDLVVFSLLSLVIFIQSALVVRMISIFVKRGQPLP